MFLPRASEIVLFHAVLARDYSLLVDQLELLAPEQVLEVRDSEQRSLYHYAALSSSSKIKQLVFSHVVDHYDRILDSHVKSLMERSHELKRYTEAAMQDSHVLGHQFHQMCFRWTDQRYSSNWVPPKVKELQRIATQRKYEDLRAVCTSADRNGRTFLHYVSLSMSILSLK